MAPSSRPPNGPTIQPPGVEGEGMDPYPTYRDGPTTPHRTTSTKPTDVGLPRSRRTYGMPIFIGLVAFALILLGLLLWGGMNAVETTSEAMNPRAVSATTPPTVEAPEATGSLRQNEAPVQPAPAEQ